MSALRIGIIASFENIDYTGKRKSYAHVKTYGKFLGLVEAAARQLPQLCEESRRLIIEAKDGAALRLYENDKDKLDRSQFSDTEEFMIFAQALRTDAPTVDVDSDAALLDRTPAFGRLGHEPIRKPLTKGNGADVGEHIP